MKNLLALFLALAMIFTLTACGGGQGGEGALTAVSPEDLNDEELQIFEYLVNSSWTSEIYTDDIEGTWDTPEYGITVDFQDDFTIVMDNNGEVQTGNWYIEYLEQDDVYVIMSDFGDEVYETYLWDFEYYIDFINFDANIGIAFVSQEISGGMPYEDGGDATEDENAPPTEPQAPTSTKTEVAVEIDGNMMTMTCSGYAVELFWQLAAQAEQSGSNEEILFYPSLFADTYKADDSEPTVHVIYFDTIYYTSDGELDGPSGDYSSTSGEMYGNIVYTVDLTKPIVGLGDSVDFYDVYAIDNFVLHVIGGDVEHYEEISGADIAVTGEQTEYTGVARETTPQEGDADTITAEPQSQTTDIAVDVKGDVLTLTISGRAAESFWIEVQKAKIGEALIPTLAIGMKSWGTADADFVVTYNDHTDQISAWEPVSGVTYDENTVTFTALIADLPPNMVFDAAGNKSEEPFDPFGIEAFDLMPPDGTSVNDWEWYDVEEVSLTVQ